MEDEAMTPRFPQTEPKTEKERLERKRKLYEWLASPDFLKPDPKPVKVTGRR
jgi:hypothetical protein